MKNILKNEIKLIIIIFNILPLFILDTCLIYNTILKTQNNNISKKLENELQQASLIERQATLTSTEENLLNYIDNIGNVQKEINKLNATIDNLLNEKNNIYNQIKEKELLINNLEITNTQLNKKLKELSSYEIKGVKTINQYPKYPNGCEPVALTILLNYHNINIDAESIMNALPKGEVPHYENGIFYGGNPNYEFLGDPRSYSGWGIWDKGLEITANKFKSPIINGTGMDFKEIIKLLRENRPVIVWTSINLQSPYIAATWRYKQTGEIITWKNFNHAVVVTGYTEDSIIISDPINGKIRYMNKQKFIDVYNYMGKKALYY